VVVAAKASRSTEAPTLDAATDLGQGDVVGINADAAVACVDHYVVLLWRRNVVQLGVDWTRTAFMRVSRAMPKRKIVFLTVVETGCEIASSDIRRELAKVLRTHESEIACASIVFEEGGFRMTILRSVITAINVTSGIRFPQAVFSSLDTALSWIDTRTRPGDPTLRPKLMSTLRGMRSHSG
jgi:hypothetical protein